MRLDIGVTSAAGGFLAAVATVALDVAAGPALILRSGTITGSQLDDRIQEIQAKTLVTLGGFTRTLTAVLLLAAVGVLLSRTRPQRAATETDLPATAILAAWAATVMVSAAARGAVTVLDNSTSAEENVILGGIFLAIGQHVSALGVVALGIGALLVGRSMRGHESSRLSSTVGLAAMAMAVAATVRIQPDGRFADTNVLRAGGPVWPLISVLVAVWLLRLAFVVRDVRPRTTVDHAEGG